MPKRKRKGGSGRPKKKRKIEHTWKECILEVLEDANEPMSVKDITEEVIERYHDGDYSAGKTPKYTVNATLSEDIRNKGDDALFYRDSAGIYGLTSFSEFKKNKKSSKNKKKVIRRRKKVKEEKKPEKKVRKKRKKKAPAKRKRKPKRADTPETDSDPENYLPYKEYGFRNKARVDYKSLADVSDEDEDDDDVM